MNDGEGAAAGGLTANEYRCGFCDGVFEKGQPDADAEASFAQRFPGARLEESAVVCDDCYEQMKAAGLFGVPPPAAF